jgi:hypothetical protein
MDIVIRYLIVYLKPSKYEHPALLKNLIEAVSKARLVNE